jgi:hypothetical protein
LRARAVGCVRYSLLGLCYQFYPDRFYQFGPDNSVIGPVSFVPISYQQGSQGKPLKAALCHESLQSAHDDSRCTDRSCRHARAHKISGVGGGGAGAGGRLRAYLTECTSASIFESQLPHKIVNLLFTPTIQNIQLTVLWGS